MSVPTTDSAATPWNQPFRQSVHCFRPVEADFPLIQLAQDPDFPFWNKLKSLYTAMTSQTAPSWEGLIRGFIGEHPYRGSRPISGALTLDCRNHCSMTPKEVTSWH